MLIRDIVLAWPRFAAHPPTPTTALLGSHREEDLRLVVSGSVSGPVFCNSSSSKSLLVLSAGPCGSKLGKSLPAE